MTEEERKAIGQCKLLLAGDITLHILDDDGGTAYAGIVNKGYNKDLEIVLNLIEKLENMYKKEHNEHMEMKRQNAILRNNERILKEKLETQTQNYHSAMEDVNYFCGNYISKDKVRDKIEEHKAKTDCRYCNNACDSYAVCTVLKELLEEGKKNERNN